MCGGVDDVMFRQRVFTLGDARSFLELTLIKNTTIGYNVKF